MRVLVLGAGVIGVTTAWYLHRAGVEVTVVDRQPAAGLETSFANGGQISVSHPEPWANPHAPANILRWLGRSDAPLKFRLRADPDQWRWALRFLLECLPARSTRNTAATAALAISSRAELLALSAELELAYQQRQHGILHLFASAPALLAAATRCEALQRLGITTRLLDGEGCRRLEPALAERRLPLVGGIHAAEDLSGNARVFTQQLAARLQTEGVEFRFSTEISRLVRAGSAAEGPIDHLQGRSKGEKVELRADGYVLCAASESGRLLNALGMRSLIYPLKGYSLTLPLRDPARGVQCSLTDEARRIVCSRLGDSVRIAGTAELNGFDTGLRAERLAPLRWWAEQNFPDQLELDQAEPWTGLRPARPDNLALIGRGPAPNLWLNTGHGSLGWTLACGSALALRQLMLGEVCTLDYPLLRRTRR